MAKPLSLLLFLALTSCFSNSFAENRKELRTKDMKQHNVIQLGRALPPNTIDPSRVTQLSWRPRVFLYKNFLSNEECDHLISLGNNKKENSKGKNSKNATERSIKLEISVESEDEIAAKIEERISAWTFLPKGSSKPIHVLHVGPEEHKPNHNYFGNTTTQLTGESVLATVVLYLSNVTLGGHILFPQAELGSSKLKNKIWSDCGKSDKTVRPTKGNAILFFNLRPNASLDRHSSHARCPVIEGDMWWATKVFVVKSIAKENVKSSEDDLCTDEDESCPRWASTGECDRNPIFMIGNADYYGTCRKSCKVC